MAEQEIDPRLVQRVEEVANLCAEFIQQHQADEEFAGAILYALGELVDHVDDPLMQDTAKLWAGAILYAVADESNLLEPNSRFPLSGSIIAAHFELNLSDIQTRAIEVQRLLDELEADSFDPLLELGADDDFLDEDEDIYPLDYEVQEGEFIDIARDVDEKYFETMSQFILGPDPEATEAALRELIKAEPDFLFPYLDLATVLVDDNPGEADMVLGEAVQRAERIIVSANNGTWPRLMEYGRVNNRHLLSVFKAQAIRWWELGEAANALDIFRRLLEVNPLDEMNIRFYIAALREGLTLDQYLELDEVEDEPSIFADPFRTVEPSRDDSEWFETMEAKYPDEFATWRENFTQRELELDLRVDPAAEDEF